jgi:acyl-coenzyme A synthetase/AMP-(fatty) acid ligase
VRSSATARPARSAASAADNSLTLSASRRPLSFGRCTLAHYKVPRVIEFSDRDLPKNAAGKIMKRLLRERFWVQEERAVS